MRYQIDERDADIISFFYFIGLAVLAKPRISGSSDHHPITADRVRPGLVRILKPFPDKDVVEI